MICSFLHYIPSNGYVSASLWVSVFYEQSLSCGFKKGEQKWAEPYYAYTYKFKFTQSVIVSQME